MYLKIRRCQVDLDGELEPSLVYRWIKLDHGLLQFTGSNSSYPQFFPGLGPIKFADVSASVSGGFQYGGSFNTDLSDRFSTQDGQKIIINTGGNSVAFGTAISGSTTSLNKLGSGTLALNAANSYGGGTNVFAGVLAINAVSGGQALPVAQPVSISSGAILDNNASITIGLLDGAGTVDLAGGSLVVGGGVNGIFGSTFSGGLVVPDH